MFKYLPCLGGSTSRCRFTTLLLMAFVAISFSSVAQAQHAVSIVKGCTSPARICDTDADCNVDDNACTIDTCNLDIPDMLNCQFTVRNEDGFFDTLSINGAWDIVFNNGGPTRVPAVGNADILYADGNTTCVVGPFVPCTIGADQGVGAGYVTFVSTGYSPTAADPNPLQDQVTVLVEDLCDGQPDPGCFPGIDNPVSFVASTILVPGCLPPEDVVCPPDEDLCTEDFECDPATGECPPPGPPLVCPPRADGVICDLCDPTTGECVPDDPLPPICLPNERCRTPGFWGARGGNEKASKSQNITQAVIDQAILENGLGLPVCGIYIDNTDLLSNFSAIEAICVSVMGVTERQLVRQLTAAALNCVLGDCNPAHTAMLAGCNAVCDTGVGDMQACIDALDCFNNGGDWDGIMCTTGAGFCEIGGEACDDVNTCVGLGDSCLPVETCHDRDLCPDFDDDGDINGSDFCFEPPGPASSPRKCNAARKNDVYVP